VGTAAAAIEAGDEHVTVVVLDRNLPDGDGIESIDRLKAVTDGAFVVAVTGVDPGLEIVDVGVDDYLVKPVRADRLLEAVEALDARHDYERAVARYYALAARRAAIESAQEPSSLRDDERYRALVDEIRDLHESVDVGAVVVSDPRRARAVYRDLPVASGSD